MRTHFTGQRVLLLASEAPGSIAPIFKRVAQWIGMPDLLVNRVSGHAEKINAARSGMARAAAAPGRDEGAS
jgi:hypothetical protein